MTAVKLNEMTNEQAREWLMVNDTYSNVNWKYTAAQVGDLVIALEIPKLNSNNRSYGSKELRLPELKFIHFEKED